MSFTALFAALALLAPMFIFGLTYKTKGAKTAFITTGIAFIILKMLFIAIIYTIIIVMPN